MYSYKIKLFILVTVVSLQVTCNGTPVSVTEEPEGLNIKNQQTTETPVVELDNEHVTTDFAITSSASFLPPCKGTTPVTIPCYSADRINLPTRQCPEGFSRDSHGVCRPKWNWYVILNFKIYQYY